jgi:hypothetical protein
MPDCPLNADFFRCFVVTLLLFGIGVFGGLPVSPIIAKRDTRNFDQWPIGGLEDD